MWYRRRKSAFPLTVETNEQIPALAADLAKLADVKYEGRKAIVCLVGENLRDTPGMAAKVFGILEDVKIRMISQGASEINLTFVIEEDAAPKSSGGSTRILRSRQIRKSSRETSTAETLRPRRNATGLYDPRIFSAILGVSAVKGFL